MMLTRGLTGRSANPHAAAATWETIATLAHVRKSDPQSQINWVERIERLAEGQKEIIRDLNRAVFVPLQGTFYRATFRPITGEAGSRDHAEVLKVPPPRPDREGRFHGFLEHALYLGRTAEHLAYEMTQNGDTGPCVVGKYELPDPFGTFLSLLPEHTIDLPSLNWVACESERRRKESLQGGLADPYVATQLLRHVCEKVDRRIDGIVYPTVQGPYRRDAACWNVAVFSEQGIESLHRRIQPEFWRRTAEIHSTWM